MIMIHKFPLKKFVVKKAFDKSKIIKDGNNSFEFGLICKNCPITRSIFRINFTLPSNFGLKFRIETIG